MTIPIESARHFYRIQNPLSNSCLAYLLPPYAPRVLQLLATLLAEADSMRPATDERVDCVLNELQSLHTSDGTSNDLFLMRYLHHRKALLYNQIRLY